MCLLADLAFVDGFSTKDQIRQAGEACVAADQAPMVEGAISVAVIQGLNDSVPAFFLVRSGASVAGGVNCPIRSTLVASQALPDLSML